MNSTRQWHHNKRLAAAGALVEKSLERLLLIHGERARIGAKDDPS